jgi:nucleoside-diphosphate-sugar epimerase
MLEQGEILITGATGYIGFNLVKSLLGSQKKIHIVVREKSNIDKLKLLSDNLIFHIFNGKSEQLHSIFAKSKPKAVFHLAAKFVQQHDIHNIESLVESNLLFAIQLIDAAAESGVKYFLNAGSYLQYGINSRHPSNLYAAMKSAFEEIINYYIKTTKMKACSLIIFDTYGPNDTRGKVMQRLLECCKRGEKLQMSPGEQKLDLVHIDDVVNAFLKAYEYLRLHEEDGIKNFGVSSGKLISLKELVALINKINNEHLCIDFGAKPYRKNEVMEPWQQFERIPGWNCEWDLDKGISSLLK